VPSKRLLAIACAAFLTVSFAGPANANPGCNLDDIGGAIKDTFTQLPPSCSLQAADPAFYPLTGFLIAFVQTPQGQSFCSAVGRIDTSFSDAQKKLAGYWGSLSQDQQNSLKAGLDQYIPGLGSIVSDISSASSDAGAALQLVSCACKVAEWKGPGELAGDFGACVGDALCAAQDWLHEHVSDDFASCSSTPPPPPQLIDCRVDPCAAGMHNCSQDTPVAGQAVQCYGGDPGYTCQGSFCFSESLFQTGQGNYCYCPPVMQRPDGFIYDIDGSCEYYVRCACPDGSKPLSAEGAGAYICICPDTGQPVNADGTCPPPPPPCNCGCQNNQILISKDTKSCTCTCGCPDGQFNLGNKCVTPCANAGDVQLMDGSCCPASQANSCGVCCPSGMKPDEATGSCVSATPPKPLLPKLPPQPNTRR
jgi:hypothetical protein